ncbi:MAG TPA: hypothetical protein VNI83_02255 [Vicinamibacterales bacterium]|nr:hypothetical protein [Vicinamibacterales bacterium]
MSECLPDLSRVGGVRFTCHLCANTIVAGGRDAVMAAALGMARHLGRRHPGAAALSDEVVYEGLRMSAELRRN